MLLKNIAETIYLTSMNIPNIAFMSEIDFVESESLEQNKGRENNGTQTATDFNFANL